MTGDPLDPFARRQHTSPHVLDRPSRTTRSRIGDFGLRKSPETRPFESPRVAENSGAGVSPRYSDTIRRKGKGQKGCQNKDLGVAKDDGFEPMMHLQ